MAKVLRLIGKPLISKQLYSTAVSASAKSAARLGDSDPGNYTRDHVGAFYTVPEPDVKNLFSFGGLPKSFEVNAKTFAETCLMIRSPAVDIINYMKKTDFDRPVIRYLLYGKIGCGKSLSMAHVIHYAYVNEFVLFHVPWVWNWLRNGLTEVTYSTSKPGFVNLPLMALHWLKHFKSQNEALITKLNLKTEKDYVWNQRENTPAGSPLLELVNFGINRVKYADDVIDALISETKSMSSSKKCKTFVAIDGFNAMFGDFTYLKTEDKTKVVPSNVALVTSFLNICKQDWNNGAVVLTVDQFAGYKDTLVSHLPLYLLKKKGFEHIDPFITIPVSEFSDLEFHSMLDYYEDRQWFQRKEGRDELKFLTNSNPYSLMNLCSSL